MIWNPSRGKPEQAKGAARLSAREAEVAAALDQATQSLPKADQREITQFLLARVEWDRRFGKMSDDIRFLKGALLLALCAVIFVAWRNTQLAGQADVVPFVVEVDRFGRASAVTELKPFRGATDPDVESHLHEFITDMRTIADSPIAQQDRINRAYHYTRGDAQEFVDTYFRLDANNPQKLGREFIRQVEVVHARQDPRDRSKWDLEWRETIIPLRGGTASIQAWKGSLAVQLDPPKQREALLRNHLGIFVTNLTWSPVSQPKPVNVDDARSALDSKRRQRMQRNVREMSAPPLAAEAQPALP